MLGLQAFRGIRKENRIYFGSIELATHYMAEYRVWIVEADEVQITSVVIGKSGVNEQTIRLKDGSLGTHCTCPLNEQPFCRHSVAALLEYHRWCQPKESHRPPTPTSVEPPAVRRPISTVPASDIKLSEVAVFVECLQAAVKAMEDKLALPARPQYKAMKCRHGSTHSGA